MTRSFERKLKFLVPCFCILFAAAAIVISFVPETASHIPPLTIATIALVSASPNPAGVGQTINISVGLNLAPPTATATGGDRWMGFTVDVTKPDGTIDHAMVNGVSDVNGSTYTLYTPIIAGSYTIKFSFPGQVLHLAGYTGIPGQASDYVNDTFLASSNTTFLSVGQTPPTPTPLPTPPTPAPTPALPAKTSVIGILSSNATWTETNSPYGFTGPVAVGVGVTLTIEPGATVYLNGYYLQVNGTLVAKGASLNPVQLQNGLLRFTPVSNGWNDKANSGCIIENANLTSITVSAVTALKLDQDSISDSAVNVGGSSILTNDVISSAVSVGDSSTISHSTLANGIAAGNNCIFTYNTIEGIGISAGDVCSITGNNVHAGVITGNSSIISNNIIQGSVQGGVISNNTIFVGFGNYNVKGTTVSNNNITGATVTAASAITNNFIVSGNYSEDFRVFGGYATYTESTPAISGSGSPYISGNTLTGGGSFTSAFIFSSSTSIVPAIDLSSGGPASISNNVITGRSGLAINSQASAIFSNVVTGDIIGSASAVYNNTVYGSLQVNSGGPTISSNIVSGAIAVGATTWNITGNTAAAITASVGNGIISDNTVMGTNGNATGFEINGTIVNANSIGIDVSGGGTIQRNYVANNTYGIVANGTVAIINNTITGNNVAIALYPVATATTINYNNIQSNSQSIFLEPGTTSNVDATLNWWGSVDTQAINQSIFDNKRDFNLGTVTFIPFLMSPNTQATPTTQARIGPSPTPSTAPTPTPSPVPIQSPSSSPATTSSTSPSATTQTSELPSQSSSPASSFSPTPQIPEFAVWITVPLAFTLVIIALILRINSKKR